MKKFTWKIFAKSMLLTFGVLFLTSAPYSANGLLRFFLYLLSMASFFVMFMVTD